VTLLFSFLSAGIIAVNHHAQLKVATLNTVPELRFEGLEDLYTNAPFVCDRRRVRRFKISKCSSRFPRDSTPE
jgi:hypothetical protein